MKETQFIREANYLFSNAYLDSVNHEQPYYVASNKLAIKFKALLKTLFKDCEITVNKGYCECSAFVSRGDKHVYVSFSDLRYWSNWSDDVLIRTAKHTKDWTGGVNNRSTIKTLQKDVYALLERA